MDNYENRCPDCHEDGGNGVRCLKHQDEWLDIEIDRLMKKKEEITKIRLMRELDNELSSSRTSAR